MGKSSNQVLRKAYEALKVYVPSYESYGRMWPHMHMRIVAVLVIYKITMLGYFGAKKFVYAAFLVPLPILSIIFAYICSKIFYRFFSHDALEVLVQDKAKETPILASIFRVFIPPCLKSEKFDDADQFEDALSHVSESESSELPLISVPSPAISLLCCVTDDKKYVLVSLVLVNKIFEELEGYEKKVAHAEVVFEAFKTASKPEETRHTNKIGFLGLVGEKVDTITYCKEKIEELVPKLESE
ncbi:hypothetical protein Syun_028230 [Stephania yunnanensis]|uniref:Uncharacterized protein n=1 Tax=Stephania yunnanensis TaxID=152371 RepID=A0AAP0EHC8_9MAGN